MLKYEICTYDPKTEEWSLIHGSRTRHRDKSLRYAGKVCTHFGHEPHNVQIITIDIDDDGDETISGRELWEELCHETR